MDIIYTDRHRLRNPQTELSGGELVTPFECPRRAELIREHCVERGIGAVAAPADYPATLPQCVHRADYVQFIDDCWRDWQAAGYRGEAIATCWPSRAMPRRRVPQEIDGRVGYYALAAETTTRGATAEAAHAAAAAAASAADRLSSGARSVFALCRPPGHHAASDMFGGYCFFNNVAIAAQRLLDGGAQRIAILDTDFHHGNGTQEIFYRRADVLFASLHGDPRRAFPYFLGYSDERGEADGEGYTFNYPLPPGTAFEQWNAALQQALRQIRDYAPDYLLISLGTDTFYQDPISFFKLHSDDFTAYGADIGRLNRPTAFIMEGGYAVNEIGTNVANTLSGFLETHQ